MFISLNNNYFTGCSTEGLVGSPKSQAHTCRQLKSIFQGWRNSLVRDLCGSQTLSWWGNASNSRKDFWVKTDNAVLYRIIHAVGHS